MTGIIDRLSAAIAGRYDRLRYLGEGGMAAVYRAHDMRHGRDVAIKALRPEIAVSIGAERFAREIRALARLQHPHILPLTDSGETNDLLFYVMPFVEGESLRSRLEQEGSLLLNETSDLCGR